MKKIALVDDDEVHSRHYSDALKVQGFDVAMFSGVGDAIHIDPKLYDLIVCDLMMPSDEYFHNEGTSNGVLTGLRLTQSLHADGDTTPIVLLTNLNMLNVLDDVAKELEGLQNVVLMKKSEFDPIEFSQVALAVINGEEVSSLPPALGARLADSIELKAPIVPGLLSLDLKRLFAKGKRR